MKKALPSQGVFQDASDRRAKDGRVEMLLAVPGRLGSPVRRHAEAAAASGLGIARDQGTHYRVPTASAELSLLWRSAPVDNLLSNGAHMVETRFNHAYAAQILDVKNNYHQAEVKEEAKPDPNIAQD
jgi:hypothetical protein